MLPAFYLQLLQPVEHQLLTHRLKKCWVGSGQTETGTDSVRRHVKAAENKHAGSSEVSADQAQIWEVNSAKILLHLNRIYTKVFLLEAVHEASAGRSRHFIMIVLKC
ncbi:hypothetical protein GOODEAATRI_010540 [Goodea atripinnis]|uniref:Uncharacterized protein n=1 Tax=Goodea atripinnis TaxID=208336 RepID=A0ABV0N0A5_9TELE